VEDRAVILTDKNRIDMEKELILNTMKEAGKPVSAGEVATLWDLTGRW